MVDVFEAISREGCEQALFCHDPQTGLRAIIAIHDTTLGPSLGGVRMRPYPTEEEALADVLDLARAMTYKFAAAGIDLGGGKSVIIGDPATAKSEDLLRAFGRFVRTLGGRYIPGIDVGTTQDDMRTIGLEAEPVSCVGVDPSPYTALGVYAAIRACIRHATGSPDLEGARIAIQGVGHVGEALARRSAEAGADLVLADVDGARAERLAKELDATAVDADDIVTVACDVLAPCAVGGVIDEETVARLGCRVVAGGANNVLADPRVAETLRARGIVYAPDYVANAGGVILLDTERAGDPPERAADRCWELGDRMRHILERADAEGISTLAAANGLAEQRLGEGRSEASALEAQLVTRAQRVRRYYELVDAGRLEEMYALFHDDVVYRRPGYEPLEGIEALRGFYEGERVIREGAHTVSSVALDGERIAVEGEFGGVLHDGSRVTVRFADFFVFRGGRIARRDTYFDAPLV